MANSPLDNRIDTWTQANRPLDAAIDRWAKPYVDQSSKTGLLDRAAATLPAVWQGMTTGASPQQLGGHAARVLESGKPSDSINALDSMREGADKALQQELSRPESFRPTLFGTRGDVVKAIAPQMPQTLETLGAGAAGARMGAAFGPAGIIGGGLIGGAASLLPAYHESQTRTAEEVTANENQKRASQGLQPMSLQERQALEKRIEPQTQKIAAAEIGTELPGMALEAIPVLGPFAKMGAKPLASALSKQGLKTGGMAAAKAMGATALTEPVEEATSRMMQQPVERELGLTQDPAYQMSSMDDWKKAYGEVVEPTLVGMIPQMLLGGGIGGAGAIRGGRQAYQRNASLFGHGEEAPAASIQQGSANLAAMLEAKRNGTPADIARDEAGNPMLDEQQQPVVVPAVPGQKLNRDEIDTLNYLQRHADNPEKLAKRFGMRVGEDAPITNDAMVEPAPVNQAQDQLGQDPLDRPAIDPLTDAQTRVDELLQKQRGRPQQVTSDDNGNPVVDFGTPPEALSDDEENELTALRQVLASKPPETAVKEQTSAPNPEARPGDGFDTAELLLPEEILEKELRIPADRARGLVNDIANGKANDPLTEQARTVLGWSPLDAQTSVAQITPNTDRTPESSSSAEAFWNGLDSVSRQAFANEISAPGITNLNWSSIPTAVQQQVQKALDTNKEGVSGAGSTTENTGVAAPDIAGGVGQTEGGEPGIEGLPGQLPGGEVGAGAGRADQQPGLTQTPVADSSLNQSALNSIGETPARGREDAGTMTGVTNESPTQNQDALRFEVAAPVQGTAQPQSTLSAVDTPVAPGTTQSPVTNMGTSQGLSVGVESGIPTSLNRDVNDQHIEDYNAASERLNAKNNAEHQSALSQWEQSGRSGVQPAAPIPRAAVRPATDLRTAQSPGGRLAGSIARAFGHEVIWVEAKDPGQRLTFDGSISPTDPSKILLAHDSESPVTRVVAHEMTHGLRRRAPQIYANMVQSLRSVYDQEAVRQHLIERRYLAKGETAGLPDINDDLARFSPENKAEEEWVADFVSDIIHQPSILVRVAAEMNNRQQGSGANFLNRVTQFLNTVRQKLIDAGFRSEAAIVKDQMKQAEDAVVKALAQYQQYQKTGELPMLDGDIPESKRKPDLAGGEEFTKRENVANYQMEVERKDRAVKSTAALNEAEKQAISSQAAELGADEKQAMAVARETKKRFPQSAGWDVPTAIGMELKEDKKGAKNPVIQWAKIPYRFHLESGQDSARKGVNKPLAKKISSKMVKEVEAVIQRANKGDKNAAVIMGHANWYRKMAERLRAEFGGFADVFADLLGATSPNTAVEQNWNNAIDVMKRFVRGDFDSQLNEFDQWLKDGKSVKDFKDNKPEQLITRITGAKYGMNSDKAMKALLGLWRSVKKGDAPKARNFALNLVALSDKATIDVWAARFLQRLAGYPRIPTVSEDAVQGNHLTNPDNVGGAFGFGQEAFEQAAETLRSHGLDIRAPDLQAIVWFLEKEHWTKNNWTSKAGEGGSFEEQLDKAPAYAWQAGYTIAKSGPAPENAEMAAEIKRINPVLKNDPDVIAYRILPTQGLYAGWPERSFDQEVISTTSWDPAKWISTLAEGAQREEQYDMFVSRKLGLNEKHPNARPGIEVAFKRELTAEEVQPIMDTIVGKGVDGFTLTVNPIHARTLGDSGQETDKFAGLRLQYVPEIFLRAVNEGWASLEDAAVAEEHRRLTSGDATLISNVLHEKQDRMQDAVDAIRTADDVAHSSVYRYNTLVIGKENYSDYSTGRYKTADSPFRENQTGQPIAARLETAARRLRDGAGAVGGGNVLQRESGSPDIPASNRRPNDPGNERTGRESPAAGRPTYGQTRRGAIRAVGVHYSGAERKELDGSKYGTGASGAEAERVKNAADKRLANRIYFYINAGQGVSPEQGVGGNAHTVLLKNLYDKDADPLQILENLTGNNTAEYQNNMESAIIDAGFDGYVSDFGNQRAAVLIGDHKVPVRFEGQGRPQVEEGGRAEPNEVKQIAKLMGEDWSRKTPEAWGKFLQTRRPDLYSAYQAAFVGTSEKFWPDEMASRVKKGAVVDIPASNTRRDRMQGMNKKPTPQQATSGDSSAGAPLAVARSSWDGFPDAVVLHSPGDVLNHPDYRAAKEGNLSAAMRLINDVVTASDLVKVRAIVGDGDTLVVAVHAEEAQGRNKIPLAYAARIADEFGKRLDVKIVQVKQVNRSGSDGIHRLATRVNFSGAIYPNDQYLLVDDTLTQGGTIADLKGFIESNGGKVLGATVLMGKQYSAKLRPSAETIQGVRSRYGRDFESWWKREFGYGLDKLTESEARYLLKIRGEDADSLRNRLLEARQRGVGRLADGANAQNQAGTASQVASSSPNADKIRDRVTEAKQAGDRSDSQGSDQRIDIAPRQPAGDIPSSNRRQIAQQEFAAVEAQYRDTPQWLKAPNGKPTNLDERQWVQVRTPSFKKWFGDWEAYANGQDGNGVWAAPDGVVSKVVDENGEPKVVHHGTIQGGFTILDPDQGDSHRSPMVFTAGNRSTSRTYSGSSTEIDMGMPPESADDLKKRGYDLVETEGGIEVYDPNGYLLHTLPTMDEAVAEGIDDYRMNADEHRENGDRGIYSLFLNIRNPFEENFEGANWDGNAEGLYEVVESDGFTNIYGPGGERLMSYDDAEAVAEKSGGNIQEAAPLDHTTNTIAEEAKRGGNDGAIIRQVVDDGGKMGVADVDDVFVIFDAKQAKSATQNTGEFGPSMDLRFSNRRNVLNQPALATWTQTPQSKASRDLTKLITTWQDSQYNLKKIEQDIRKASGRISDEYDPYQKEILYHGRAERATKDFLQKELRPLTQAMISRNISMDQLGTYLWNRHAEERNEQIARLPNSRYPDGGSGIKTADARAYLAALPAGKRQDLEAVARMVDGITRGTRQLLVNEGLEKQSTIDAWQNAYGKYVPLQRDELDYVDDVGMGIGQGFASKGSASKRAAGSDKPVNVTEILANIAMQRERAITRSEKKRVGLAAFGMAILNPNPDFWLPVMPGQDLPELAQELQAMGLSPAEIDGLMMEPKKASLDKNNQLVMSTLRNRDNVLPVRIDGKDRFLFFNPNNEEALAAVSGLKNLDTGQLHPLLNFIATVPLFGTRWTAAVNTAYSIVFGMTNFMRDTGGAMVNLSSTPLAGQKSEVLSNLGPALKGIWTSLRAERSGQAHNDPIAKRFEEFQQFGGKTGYRDLFKDAGHRAEQIQKEIKSLQRGKALSAASAFMDMVHDYNDMLENGIRLAAYMAATDPKGINLSKDKAAALAKNLTVNFNKKGNWSTQFSAMYAFFNASVQGTARLAETLKSPAGKKIITGGLMLGVMDAALMAMAGFDDDEPPDFVRERNFIIPTGGDSYISIPYPLGLHILPNIGRQVAETIISGGDKAGERTGELLTSLLSAFNPIGTSATPLQSLMPTVADPLAALSENVDAFGKPIYQKDRSDLDPTPGFTRVRNTATPWAKGLSEFLNWATGGNEYRQGAFSPTPDQIDYLVGQVTGGIGRDISKTAQALDTAGTGEELPPYKIPILGKFYGKTTGQAAESGKYYSNITRINEADRELQGRKENGDDVESFIAEHPEARLGKTADRTQRAISKLKKQKRELIDQGAPREQVRNIEGLITTRMKTLNDQIRSLQ